MLRQFFRGSAKRLDLPAVHHFDEMFACWKMPVKRAYTNAGLARYLFQRGAAAALGKFNCSNSDELFPISAGIRPQPLRGCRWFRFLQFGQLLMMQYFGSRGDWGLNPLGQAAMFKKRRRLRLSCYLRTNTLFGACMSCFLRLERN